MSSDSRSRRAALCALAFLVSLGSAAAGAPLDPDLYAGRAEGEPVSVLVVLREQADLAGVSAVSDRKERARLVYESLRGTAELSQRPLRARLEREGVSYRAFWAVNMLEVHAPRRLAAELAGRADVARIAANRSASLRRKPRTPPLREGSRAETVEDAAEIEWNVARVRAPEVWAQGFTGQGIVVANADTGFEWNHPALRPHYRGFDGVAVDHSYNWHDAVHDAGPSNPCGSDSAEPCDDDGHGTATSALSVGDDGAGNQVGVAPGARLIGCRNMDRGTGTPARYTECFEFFLAPTDSAGRNPRPELGADVINNSWGCPASEGCTDPGILEAVVENVSAAGIFVVVSAGNGGSACSTVSEAPAIYAASFSVGATSSADFIANFSSRGPVTADGSNRLKPDIVAPGVNVRSAMRGGGYQAGINGTSASAPHVTGGVALLWSAAPRLRNDVAATAALLRDTAAPLTSAQDCGGFPGGEVPNAVYGFGRLDVAAAVAAAGATDPGDPGTRPTPIRIDRGERTRILPPRN